MFAQMAEVLSSKKENRFKIAAYQKAAKVLADYPIDVEEAYKKGGIKALTTIPGIGEALSKKIAEYIDTGRMKKYGGKRGRC
jgi:DNA polymerase (family 10)